MASKDEKKSKTDESKDEKKSKPDKSVDEKKGKPDKSKESKPNPEGLGSTFRNAAFTPVTVPNPKPDISQRGVAPQEPRSKTQMMILRKH